jgi:cytochrome P450
VTAESVSGYDFFAPSVRDDPFTFFARIRANDPVLATAFGYWYVTKYEDSLALLRDPALRSGRGVPDSLGLTEGPLRELMETWMMSQDGAPHARVRRLISRAFTPRAVEALRPAVEQRAAELVDDLVAHGGGDIIPALAFPLPMEVMRLLFGVDAATWKSRVSDLFDPAGPGVSGFFDQLAALIDFFRELVPARREARRDDMFSALFTPDADGDTLTDEELIANAVLLVTAGFETTMSLISLAVHTLLTHPDQLRLLLDDPSRTRGAVEEVLRYEPAALSTTRSTTQELTLRGVTIPAASNVLLSVAAGNRDPDRYLDPDTFDITRVDVRPLTFGGGAHLCIGAGLARMETEVVLKELFSRAPGLRLRGGPTTWYAGNPTVRRPTAVQVVV